jgi:hypothetical protein
MSRSEQRSNAIGLDEKEITVHALVGSKDYTDFLEVVPAFSTCTRDVLDEFVTHGVVMMQCTAGETLSPQTYLDQNLYVLVAGSASLQVGDDVVIALEAGDYFGGKPERCHWFPTSVVATSDVEFLVFDPREVTGLAQASARACHPSRIDWRTELQSTTRRTSRRNHRRAVLTSLGA